MANRKQQKGPCYKCGKEMAKGYMGRHLLAEHYDENGEQKCYLLKIEDEYSNYWLFVDIPVSSSLSTLDSFLRSVWLECCGHMSAFTYVRSYDEINMSKKIGGFAPGTILQYEYDFGSTTTLYVTFVQNVSRQKQKSAVRVMARNDPYTFECEKCGKEAIWIDASEWPAVMYCDECADEYFGDDGYLLPVVNSPRMGVCGYCGEHDHYEYVRPVLKSKK